jgi:multidrug efflux pump subunit AcrB
LKATAWLVRVALQRPSTFIVMAIMIVIFGPLAATRTPTDISLSSASR